MSRAMKTPAIIFGTALMAAGVLAYGVGVALEQQPAQPHVRRATTTSSSSTSTTSTTLDDITVSYGSSGEATAAAPVPHPAAPSAPRTSRQPRTASGGGATPTTRAPRTVMVNDTPTTDPPAPAAPQPPAASSEYAFLHKDDAGWPIRWNPCQSVPYVINPDQAPAGAIDTVKQAAAAVGRATGMNLTYAGETTATGYDGGYHIVISWRTREQTNGLIPEGSVGAANPIQKGDRYTAAVMYYVPDQPTTTATALHEFGHAVGLAHPSDTAMVMGGAQRDSYAAGDLQGLRYEGTERGCM